jgi:electron transport complex protein RnfC
VLLDLLSALRPGAPTFRHGVHPPEQKGTADRPLERMPFVDEYVLPLGQHIGAPSRARVSAGDDVQRGDVLADPGGFVSTALHAPVTGRVTAIELRLAPSGQRVPCVVLQADPWSSQEVRGEPCDPAPLPRSEVVQRIQQGGIVGLGGAAFPAHVKLTPPEGRVLRHVLLNGCECEPYLTCDHRVMLERAAEVLRGAAILAAAVEAEQISIGVELNKPDAIAALRERAPAGVEIVGLQVKYPQGAEKCLIDAVLRREVPGGGLPADVGVLSPNVGTAAALADLFDRGQPLIERALTVTGPGVVEPKNLIVPLGTPLRAVLEHCGGLRDGVRRVVLGGPMMGAAQKSLDVPTLKGTSGLLCLPDLDFEAEAERACIRCGRCLEACPMRLNPANLARFARHGRTEDLEAAHLASCFECASCSFVCPSHIPLVQWMRVGKGLVRASKAKS